jgi:hypothetical protein
MGRFKDLATPASDLEDDAGGDLSFGMDCPRCQHAMIYTTDDEGRERWLCAMEQGGCGHAVVYQDTYKPGQLIDVKGPGGWTRGRFMRYRAGAIGEDFLRVDVQELNGIGSWVGCHPDNVRRSS